MSVKAKVDFFKHLLYLKEVVLAQRISSAASKNGIKAPNLSKMMKNLENISNKILLTRTPRGITPTTDALKIVYSVEKIEKELEALMSDIKEQNVCLAPKLFIADGLTISNLDQFPKTFEKTKQEKKADVLVCPYKPQNADRLIVVQNNIGTNVIQNIWVCCRNEKAALDLAKFIILQIHGK